MLFALNLHVEILLIVSTTGLEFAYEEAPASMKAVIMSLFLLTTTVGDLLTGVVYSVGAELSKVGMALLFAAMMLANFFVFLCVRSAFLKDKNRSCNGNGSSNSSSDSYSGVAGPKRAENYTSKGRSLLADDENNYGVSGPSTAERV